MPWPSWITWFVVTGWLVSLLFVGIVARRCYPAKAWAWLTVMFALPWSGVVAYLVFGENPLGRRRIMRYRQIVQDRRSDGLAADPAGGELSATVNMEVPGLAALAMTRGAMSPVGGNEAELLAGPMQTMDRLIADIDSACSHVHMMFYIFWDDATGRRVGDALIRAARRGVTCRVLADAVASRRMFKTLGRRMSEAGVHVKGALPVNPMRVGLARLDLRYHRKIVVIDGKVGYIGSWNVVNPDYGQPNMSAWIDAMVRVAGPVVPQMQMLFLDDWNFEEDEWLSGDDELFVDVEPSGQTIAQVLPSGPMYPYLPVRDVSVAAIHLARRTVSLTTAYFVPDEPLVLAMRLAAQRGVAVHVIIPARSNHWLVDMAARSYCRDLLESGVQVHLHQHGFLHTKLLTVDEQFSMIGSANFDMRSFMLDAEANLLVYSGAASEQIRRLQRQYLDASRPMELAREMTRPRLARFSEDLLKLAAPLM